MYEKLGNAKASPDPMGRLNMCTAWLLQSVGSRLEIGLDIQSVDGLWDCTG
jgi:hypothetical protein